MHVCVARRAKCDQVFFRIIARAAAKLFVVNLKVGHCAADLASPAVATYLLTTFFVQLGIKPQARAFRLGPIHDAFPVK